jgi:hypothetical protein
MKSYSQPGGNLTKMWAAVIPAGGSLENSMSDFMHFPLFYTEHISFFYVLEERYKLKNKALTS